MESSNRGPLVGLRVIELAGAGPGPFCGMLLSDYGADVIRVDRITDRHDTDTPAPLDAILGRGRRSIAINLKQQEGVDLLLDLVADADALIEGFRPGVMERLGAGPSVCLGRNPRLVYGRVTGWGRDGPYANMAGHDLNYIAIAGALHPIGRREEPPTPPLNLLGDFGGGGMLLAVGMLAALVAVAQTGRGQVVDAAMVDGSALLMTMLHGLRAAGSWVDERESNFNDLGSHYYQVYETADGHFVTVAAIEPRFYAELLLRMGFDVDSLPEQNAREHWPEMKRLFSNRFRSKTLDEWNELLLGTDACYAPVVAAADAPAEPHNVLRRTFVEVAGVVQPAPAPRFSQTPAAIQGPPPEPGQHSPEVLLEAGLTASDIDRLRHAGAIE